MPSFTTDQKADLALLASVVVPTIVAVVQALAPKLKSLTPGEKFKQNVIVREETSPAGRARVRYLVNPAFVRIVTEGRHEIPSLGRLQASAEDVHGAIRERVWLDLVDVSAGQDSTRTLRINGTVPIP